MPFASANTPSRPMPAIDVADLHLPDTHADLLQGAAAGSRSTGPGATCHPGDPDRAARTGHASQPPAADDDASGEARHSAPWVGLAQLLGTALAAVTSAFVASRLGVAGTSAGAAFGSVVSSIGAAVYVNSIQHAGRRLRTGSAIAGRVVAARVPGWSPAGGTVGRSAPASFRPGQQERPCRANGSARPGWPGWAWACWRWPGS